MERDNKEKTPRKIDSQCTHALDERLEGLWEWHITTDAAFFSDHCKDMIGESAALAIDRMADWLRRVHPQDRDALREQLLERLPYCQTEYRVLCRDGSYKWLLSRSHIVESDAAGAPLRVLGLIADLNRGKNTEQALQESEIRHRTVLETMVDPLITIDEMGIIESFNPAAERMFGYAADEVLGRNVKALMPEPYHSEHDNYLENYKTTGQAKILGIGREVTALRKNGDTLPVELAVSEMQLGEKRMFVGTLRDISERKLGEEALKDSATRHHTVLDTMVDPLITIDEKGIIESFNPAAERMFGYSASETIEQNVKILMPEPYHSEHDGYLQRYHTTGEPHILGIGREVVARRKNGETLPVELAVSEMRIGEKRMYTGTLRDISERKRSERMKSEFISTVSHELRTPLTSIRGSLGLLTGGAMGELPPQVASLLKIASNNTERLLLLINDILDIEKIEAGKMAFKFQNIEIMPLVEQALAAIETFGTQHGVRFEITQRADRARVFADPDRLIQVLNNLLSNAAKFSPAGDRIEVAVASRDHGVRISVTDHGPGIPEDFQPKVFEKFTQSDASDTRKAGGTGLGLSITKAIVEKHGGKIDFVTRRGLGTTFYFDLPVTECIVEEKETHIKRRHGYGMQEHILIVEDDQDIATLLRRMLAEAGLDSDIAHNAAQATALLRQHPQRYAAMTLDLNLPDQDGIAFLQELRQKEATQKLPVIIVSATADSRHQLSGSAIGVIDWLQKPIDPQQLQYAIQQSIASAPIPRILHVEDDPDVRQLITLMLQDQAEVVAADSIEMARHCLQEQPFNLVLLDIGMPDGSGLDLIRIIENCDRPPQVVIFSAQEVDQALAHHVSATLLKSTTSNVDLVKTIRSILAKKPPSKPTARDEGSTDE